MAQPIIYSTPPLAGRPPFATDEPDSMYDQRQPEQTRRLRQPPPADPNARTSAYNVYVCMSALTAHRSLRVLASCTHAYTVLAILEHSVKEVCCHKASAPQGCSSIHRTMLWYPLSLRAQQIATRMSVIAMLLPLSMLLC
ncbi:hypothetical protein BV20DRAFT_633703 [Pilatotrama ljubarskyi]|nr:hypothetical protein BV20DRAFT_633703 [Pilatotrama ljubarskyi]